MGWRYDGEPDRLCYSVAKELLILNVRSFGDEDGMDYQVKFEVKGANVTGTCTSGINKDRIYGFDVMLEHPVLLNQNEVVMLSATIGGPESYFCAGGATKILRDGVSVAFRDAPIPNNS